MKIINLEIPYLKITIFLLAVVIIFILAQTLAHTIDEIFFKKIRKKILPFTSADFDMFDSKCCKSIAFQLENSNHADTEFGDLSRECAIFILNGLAENMGNDKNLSEYFLQKSNKK